MTRVLTSCTGEVLEESSPLKPYDNSGISLDHDVLKTTASLLQFYVTTSVIGKYGTISWPLARLATRPSAERQVNVLCQGQCHFLTWTMSGSSRPIKVYHVCVVNIVEKTYGRVLFELLSEWSTTWDDFAQATTKPASIRGRHQSAAGDCSA